MRLGNLHPTRDLNYVANIVEGFLKAASIPEAIGQTINLGSGREISIGDLAKLIARLCGAENTIESDEQRVRPDKSEVERLLADSALEDGLAQTIEWMRQHLNRYRSDVYNI